MTQCVLIVAVATSLGLVTSLMQSPARAQSDAEMPAQGDWSVTPGLVVTADYLSVVKGGLKRGARGLTNTDLTLEVAHASSGWTFNGYVLHNQGGVFNDDYVGSLQAVSNIDTTDALHLYELWAQKSWLDGEAYVAAGIIDLNSRFDVQESGGLFLQSAHGIGSELAQTGVNGPSIFPLAGPAVVVQIPITDGWWTRFGIFDAVPGSANNPDRFSYVRLSKDEGALVIGELEHRTDAARLVIGGWRYTTAFDALDDVDPDTGEPLRRRDNEGAYVSYDRTLIAPATDDGPGKVTGWVRAGFANSRINSLSHYVGGGLVWTGPVAARPLDQLGLAVAMAHRGQADRRLNPGRKTETVTELTYRAVLSETLALQPSLQHVHGIGEAVSPKSTWVAALRFEWTVF
ncbi:MAG: carbohydrate porin [Asticcacaulis sp.]